MEILEKDPIIAFYLKMSKSTEHETALPLFSETMLRLAMKEVLGKFRQLKPTELQLYRKLILFYYSNYYRRLDDLAEIMRCFNENELNECFAQTDVIVSSWNKFTEDNFRNIIYKEAFTEILFEWCRRFHHLFGEVDKKVLQLKAVEVQKLLHWGLKQASPWLRNFEAMIANSNLLKSTPEIENINVGDLEIPKIMHDIKHKLNPLVRSAEPLEDSNGKEMCGKIPPKKKARTEIMKFLVFDVDKLENRKDVPVLKSRDAKDRAFDNNSEIALSEKEAVILNDEEDKYEVEYIEDANTEEELNNKKLTSKNIVKQGEQLLNAKISKINNPENLTDEGIEEVNEETSKIIDYDTAMSYISALQAYALVNGHFEAIGYLDEVDSNFRVKKSI